MWVSVYNIDILCFVAGPPSQYFLRGQMPNMTFESGTLSWFVMQAINSLMERSWETLLVLNLLRYTRGAAFLTRPSKPAKFITCSVWMLLLVSRFACSWAGKLRRAVLMFCPSCCKPMEMTPSCSRSLKTSSWRCRSHTQSELCLAPWLRMKCTESSKTRTEGTLEKSHLPTHTSLNNIS